MSRTKKHASGNKDETGDEDEPNLVHLGDCDVEGEGDGVTERQQKAEENGEQGTPFSSAVDCKASDEEDSRGSTPLPPSSAAPSAPSPFSAATASVAKERS